MPSPLFSIVEFGTYHWMYRRRIYLQHWRTRSGGLSFRVGILFPDCPLALGGSFFGWVGDWIFRWTRLDCIYATDQAATFPADIMLCCSVEVMFSSDSTYDDSCTYSHRSHHGRSDDLLFVLTLAHKMSRVRIVLLYWDIILLRSCFVFPHLLAWVAVRAKPRTARRQFRVLRSAHGTNWLRGCHFCTGRQAGFQHGDCRTLFCTNVHYCSNNLFCMHPRRLRIGHETL